MIAELKDGCSRETVENAAATYVNEISVYLENQCQENSAIGHTLYSALSFRRKSDTYWTGKLYE